MANYKGVNLANSRSQFMQAFGDAVSEYDITETITALLALADTVDLIRVAGGTYLHKLETWNDDLCTSGTLAVKIGYFKVDGGGVLTDDDDAFGSGLTNFQAAVLSSAPTRYAFEPILFNEDVIIRATVTTAATGTAIVTGKIRTLIQGRAVGVK